MNGQSSNHAGTPTPGGPTAPILPPMDPAQLFQALATMQQLTNAVNMTGIQFPWLAGMPQPPAFPPLPQFNIQSLQDQSLNQPMSPENDDKILIAQLVEYRKRDGSYKEALDALHGKNNHPASMWKDYYLDNKHRLDARVERRISHELKASGSRESVKREEIPIPSLKKPSLSSFIVDSSPPRRPPLPKPPKPSKPLVKERKPKKVASPSPFNAPTRTRQTLNSLTAPTPAFNKKIPAPHTAITIPEPPSRSPTPPTKIIPRAHLKGNQYTDEDREYFIKFIGWRLKQDPTLTRHEISEMLGQKAPHHTANSWASFWSNNHDLPDKILAAYRDNATSSVAGTSSEVSSANRRPNYRDRSTSNESAQSQDSEYRDVKEEQSDDDELLKEYSESEMGEAGGRFTEADRYLMAKHIGSYPRFSELRGQDQWEPFEEKYPQRAWKSWNNYYRVHQKELDKLAKRIKTRESEASSSSGELSDQVVRPTRLPIKGLKRKAEDSESGSISSSSKRGRIDE